MLCLYSKLSNCQFLSKNEIKPIGNSNVIVIESNNFSNVREKFALTLAYYLNRKKNNFHFGYGISETLCKENVTVHFNYVGLFQNQLKINKFGQMHNFSKYAQNP